MNARGRAASCLAAVSFLVAGCFEGTPAPEPARIVNAVGPHGGYMIPLPADAGFAEVAFEPVKATGRGRPNLVLAAYFLGPDQKSPLSAAPSDVKASVLTPEDPTPKPVALSAQPDKAKADGAVRFASEPGSFDYDELQGELSATVGGLSFTGTFHRR